MHRLSVSVAGGMKGWQGLAFVVLRGAALLVLVVWLVVVALALMVALECTAHNAASTQIRIRNDTESKGRA